MPHIQRRDREPGASCRQPGEGQRPGQQQPCAAQRNNEAQPLLPQEQSGGQKEVHSRQAQQIGELSGVHGSKAPTAEGGHHGDNIMGQQPGEHPQRAGQDREKHSQQAHRQGADQKQGHRPQHQQIGQGEDQGGLAEVEGQYRLSERHGPQAGGHGQGSGPKGPGSQRPESTPARQSLHSPEPFGRQSRGDGQDARHRGEGQLEADAPGGIGIQKQQYQQGGG